MKTFSLKKIIAFLLSLAVLMSVMILPTGVFTSAETSATPTFDANKHASYPINVTKGGAAYNYDGNITESSANGNVEYVLSTVLPTLDIQGDKEFYLQASLTVDTVNAFWQTPIFYLRSYEGERYGISLRTDGVYLLNQATNGIGENYKADFTVEQGKTYELVILSTPTTATVWIDGTEIVTYELPEAYVQNADKDNEYTADYTYMNIDTSVKFMQSDATVSDIVIYNADVKPIYNSKENTCLSDNMNINITDGATAPYTGNDITGSGLSSFDRYWLSPAPAAGSDIYFSADVYSENVNQFWAAAAFYLTPYLNISLRGDDLFIFGPGSNGNSDTLERTYNLYGKTLVTRQPGKSYNIAVAVKDMCISVWVDGIKYIDSYNCEAQLSGGYNLSVRLNYGSSETDATDFKVSNLKIWNDAEPCPVYDPETQTSYTEDLADMKRGTEAYTYNGTITEDNAKGQIKYYFDTPVSQVYSSSVYYYSATVRMDKITNEWAGPILYLRGDGTKEYGVTLQKRGALVMNKETNGVNSAEGDHYQNSNFKLAAEKDYVLTVKSAGDRFSLWVDGKAVFTDYVLPDEYKNLPANPRLTFVMGSTEGDNEVTVKDIELWNNESPVYYDFNLHTEEDGSTQYDGTPIVKTSTSGKYDMIYLTGSAIKRNTPFYMDVDVKLTETNADWSGVRIIPREGKPVDTGIYGSIQVMFRETGLYVFGVQSAGDVNIAYTQQVKLAVGRKYHIGIYSTVDSITVWVDDIKAIDNAPLKTDAFDFTNIPVNPRLKYFPGNEDGNLVSELTNISLMTAADWVNISTPDEMVYDMIKALPNREEVTLEHAEMITDARNAYEALSEQEKTLVTNYSRLIHAEDGLKYASLTAGDVNFDGILDICDMVIVQREIEGIAFLDGDAYFAGDYDWDGAIEEDDLEAIRLAILG
ncbi:MAG: dockerin type I repeat-containing protein [Clostridia bacterium]|nr:dockerin type I repeat-containing protein [Clostridia bacterium]